MNNLKQKNNDLAFYLSVIYNFRYLITYTMLSGMPFAVFVLIELPEEVAKSNKCSI